MQKTCFAEVVCGCFKTCKIREKNKMAQLQPLTSFYSRLGRLKRKLLYELVINIQHSCVPVKNSIPLWHYICGQHTQSHLYCSLHLQTIEAVVVVPCSRDPSLRLHDAMHLPKFARDNVLNMCIHAAWHVITHLIVSWGGHFFINICHVKNCTITHGLPPPRWSFSAFHAARFLCCTDQIWVSPLHPWIPCDPRGGLWFLAQSLWA